MKTTKEKIAIMQAFVDGKEVEWRQDDGTWRTLSHNIETTWNWMDLDYRIKPEPEKDLNTMIDEVVYDEEIETNVYIPSISIIHLKELLKEIVKRLPSE